MNKIDAIIEQLENELEDIICQEGDSEIASGFREALCAIRIATKGMVLVPVGFLKVAICPDHNCVDGVVSHFLGDGSYPEQAEIHQCQFCHEKAEMLSASQQGEG